MADLIALPIEPNALTLGMTIVEGTRHTVVTHLEKGACSSRGVHVNRTACYDTSIPVLVLASAERVAKVRSVAA